MAVVAVYIKPCWECDGRGWFVEHDGNGTPEQVKCICWDEPPENHDIFFASRMRPVTAPIVRGF